MQAYCDMSVTPARTLIMKLGGSEMCYGSPVWTSGVAHNAQLFVDALVRVSQLTCCRLSDTSYPNNIDAKSVLFDAMSDVQNITLVNTLGSVTVSFAAASSPRNLMTTNDIAFSPYPSYRAWRTVFTQVR